MAYTAKDPHPPQSFLYLRETTSWRCEEEGEEDKVSPKGCGQKGFLLQKEPLVCNLTVKFKQTQLFVSVTVFYVSVYVSVPSFQLYRHKDRNFTCRDYIQTFKNFL